MVTSIPNGLVLPPYLECPSCGKPAFGVLGVSRDAETEFVRRSCIACLETRRLPLPPVSKRLLYVDQSALSNMVRLRAKGPAHIREVPHSDFFQRLHARLIRLVMLQAIVCLQSSTHEEESALDDRIELGVLGLLRRLSGGVQFFVHLPELTAVPEP